MKNKKVLIIGIIVFIAIAVVAIIMMSSGSVPSIDSGIGSISRDIKRINAKEGKDNKLAYLCATATTDINYRAYEILAITIDDNFTFNEKKGYYDKDEREDEEIKVKIDYSGLTAGRYESFYKNDIVNIGTVEKINPDSGWGEIVKHDENWLLTKSSLGYYVFYSINNDWIITSSNEYESKSGAINLSDGDYGSIFITEEQDAIDMYEHLKATVKVYKVKNTDTSIQYPSIDNLDFSTVEFIDAKGNTADLSDYQFARDIVAKSLEPYGIYLRKAQHINNADDYYVEYSVMKDQAEHSYRISSETLSDTAFEEDEYNKLVEKFNRNGREYIAMKGYSDLKVYTKLIDNVYISIEVGIADGEEATYIQEIKDNIL